MHISLTCNKLGAKKTAHAKLYSVYNDINVNFIEVLLLKGSKGLDYFSL